MAEFSDKSDTSLIADCFILTIQPATVKFGQPKVALAAEVGVRQAAPAEIANKGIPVQINSMGVRLDVMPALPLAIGT